MMTYLSDLFVVPPILLRHTESLVSSSLAQTGTLPSTTPDIRFLMVSILSSFISISLASDPAHTEAVSASSSAR